MRSLLLCCVLILGMAAAPAQARNRSSWMGHRHHGGGRWHQGGGGRRHGGGHRHHNGGGQRHQASARAGQATRRHPGQNNSQGTRTGWTGGGRTQAYQGFNGQQPTRRHHHHHHKHQPGEGWGNYQSSNSSNPYASNTANNQATPGTVSSGWRHTSGWTAPVAR